MILSQDAGVVDRARGCMVGQLAGDALGSLVEFMGPGRILDEYPSGVYDMEDGGTWDTIAGQPTDDSEMALMLARSLVSEGRFNWKSVRDSYVYWLDSGPFDCGNTVYAGLRGRPNWDSQANGAMMRVSPLAIFGASHDLSQVRHLASEDARITHPNEVCLQANALFASAISLAIRTGLGPDKIYEYVCEQAEEPQVKETLHGAIREAAEEPPADFTELQGWVLIAFQNALWQLLHAPSMEEGVVDTIMRGGDTDTNAAICGALLGGVYGLSGCPSRWVDTLLGCRPEAGKPGVYKPRPEVFWPVDALELADKLLAAGESGSRS